MLLGVDRLDYTKGIDLRLRAYKELLAEGRLNPATVTMIQVAEPSRDKVDAYISLRERVERLVGEINADFGRVGFPVVHYIHQRQTFKELLDLPQLRTDGGQFDRLLADGSQHQRRLRIDLA